MVTASIRPLVADDCPVISQAFTQQGWQRPVTQYHHYLDEQHAGARTVLVAFVDHDVAGYVTVVRHSPYRPFAEQRIPEIMDFNVLIKYRRQGIGTALMARAEQLIATQSAIAGIGVGLTPDYGAAHILYVKRGYIPDGRGLIQDGRILTHGAQAVVDDTLILHLTKQLPG